MGEKDGRPCYTGPGRAKVMKIASQDKNSDPLGTGQSSQHCENNYPEVRNRKDTESGLGMGKVVCEMAMQQKKSKVAVPIRIDRMTSMIHFVGFRDGSYGGGGEWEH